jgi:hypothetical protein
MTVEPAGTGDQGQFIRKSFSILCLALLAIASGYTIYRVLSYGPDLSILHDHWIGIVGPIFAAVFSLFLVFLTKAVSGDLKITIGPINISGGASEVCFG